MLIVQNMFVDIILRSNRSLQKLGGIWWRQTRSDYENFGAAGDKYKISQTISIGHFLGSIVIPEIMII